MESNHSEGELLCASTDQGCAPASPSPLPSKHIHDIPGSGRTFSGHQWTYFSSLQQGPLRSRAKAFLASVDWVALGKYAAMKRMGIDCSLLPDIGLGYNHMVRIIEFTDGVRWVAWLKLPDLDGHYSPEDALKTKIDCEFHTISLLRQRAQLPIPEIHAYEARSDCSVNAPFMLMDCIEGNVGMDLGMEVPRQYNQSFLSGLAKIHFQLSTIQLPQIGTIVSLNPDGTFQQGPIPGLGGPFNTATEFFQAWAAKAKFGLTEERLRKASGPYAAEIVSSVSSFPESLRQLASRLSVLDSGPFPLCHGDFGHNNIIVDDAYQILSVIDWETAFAGPWEIFGDFPLTLTAVPPAMDAPWNYNEDGSPKDDDLIQKFADQEYYIAAVVQEEDRNGEETHCLSERLKDTQRQQLVTAMRLYQTGKAGWYDKLVDKFR
ncbi:protein kinase-like (PK-like) protein [Ceratocystis lukuohia]|uniref:Protein kinase-like (PK-like) protein n=1 Tax=Ceratocystis lukuohia TaxID=2019550 RepID=A0ABR4MQW7_9PEZI